MRINREEFLKQLESVLPGLSTKEIIEQSSCFIFKDGEVNTYNDEIACSQKSLLEIEAAVPAVPLISILRKLQEDELEIGVNDENTELLIKGKQRRVGINMEAEITLPIDAVDKPKKWKKLPEDFADAVAIVQSCAGGTKSVKSWAPFINIAPEYLEASDEYQATRFKITTDVSKSILVRGESIKHILNLDMTKFSETKHWIHFRNSTGLTLSCRYFIEDYPSDDLTKILKVKGKKLVFPNGLKDEIERAEVFSSENVEGSLIKITIKSNKFKIKGLGALGWYEWGPKKSEYDGKPLEFNIPTKLLSELVQKYNKCKVSANRLKVIGKKFVYVTVLGMIEGKED